MDQIEQRAQQVAREIHNVHFDRFECDPPCTFIVRAAPIIAAAVRAEVAAAVQAERERIAQWIADNPDLFWRMRPRELAESLRAATPPNAEEDTL